jgi:Leucine-rich repeat (LRR) protein
MRYLRRNGIVDLYDPETNSSLKELDEGLFKKRPDLILRIAPIGEIEEDVLADLAKTQNIKKVYLFAFRNRYLTPLGDMRNLTSLQLGGKEFDISFIEKLSLLKRLDVRGKISSLQPIAKCTALTSLFIVSNVEAFDFIPPNLEDFGVSDCASTNDFSPLNIPTLKKLSITSIRMLECVDTLSDFSGIESLRIDSSRIKRLPDMSKLYKLKSFETLQMKSWENPEILQTIPNLEKLYLDDINTKLKAEQFYFLANIKTLKSLDIRFMDSGKNRIRKIMEHFKASGKDKVLVH